MFCNISLSIINLMKPALLNYRAVLGCLEESYTSIELAYQDAIEVLNEITELKKVCKTMNVAEPLLNCLYKVRDIVNRLLNTPCLEKELKDRECTFIVLDNANELGRDIYYPRRRVTKLLKRSISDIKKELDDILTGFDSQPIAEKVKFKVLVDKAHKQVEVLIADNKVRKSRCERCVII